MAPKDKDKAEVKARAAFGACVCAINAVDSLSYRFAEVSVGEAGERGQRRSCVLARQAVEVLARGTLRSIKDYMMLQTCSQQHPKRSPV